MGTDLVADARRLYAAMETAFRTGDYEALGESIDAAYIDHGLGGGLADLKAAFAEFGAAFRDVRIEVLDAVADRRQVACRVRIEAKHTGPFWGLAGTGRRVQQEGLDLLRFAGGRLVERWGHFDDVGMARQLGLPALPVP
ncbi:MAG TPA: ester cyclase [Candidatus Thermoplasmatota archaeon]|nr:ester cyclase [Candidatus Thermoplasmatota archaeon]